MNVFIDDVIKKLLEMRNDGYYYCDIIVSPAVGDGVEGDVGFIAFEALDCGGTIATDYSDDPDDDVVEVSDDELQVYAQQYSKPAPERKPFKEIKVTY